MCIRVMCVCYAYWRCVALCKLCVSTHVYQCVNVVVFECVFVETFNVCVHDVHCFALHVYRYCIFELNIDQMYHCVF